MRHKRPEGPLKTRCFLSMLFNVANCFSLVGPPATPSCPTCHIPCDQTQCRLDIHCTWNPGQEPQIPTNYSLHWEPADKEVGRWLNGTSFNQLIPREDFYSHTELRVWVQAKNQHGSAKSEEIVFNTADIIKPPAPNVTISLQEEFEISWISTCIQLQLSVGTCEVQYRTEMDQIWLKEAGGFYGSFILDTPQNCTPYEFQVRCACDTELMSDWSSIQRIEGTETTPVGELDLWMDCGIFPLSSECILMWKKLTKSQACGVIRGYEFKVPYKNGTTVLEKVLTDEPKDRLLCEEMQCQFTLPLKDASSISVSAYNIHGATAPSYLALPLSGIEENPEALHLRMNEGSLNVTWDLPSLLAENPKKFVVQYKQAGKPPGQAFDWVTVNKSQTTIFLKGHFKKYTPYQVSLFIISDSGRVRLLSSSIGYSLQRIPSTLPSLKVHSIAATEVTLLWEPVLLSKQDGLILSYQIGLDTQNVYNVSASSQHGNRTLELLHLSPERDYEVWIRALTAVGPGEKATLRFKTNYPESFATSLVFLGIICLSAIFCLILVSTCCVKNKRHQLVTSSYCRKGPDPCNSRILREMKIDDPEDCIYIHVIEPHPTLSHLEVVEIQPNKTSPEKPSKVDASPRPVTRDRTSDVDYHDARRQEAKGEGCHSTGQKYGRGLYSKMIDSDEDKENEDCLSSSEEEPCTSGYEKHFLPTQLEILESF